ncbi:MAG: flavodoxin [Bacteroidales bacterium]|nr:flavodoxin [Bacteroidales bacterium]HRX31551.1 flavodoxin domain-containing protein [Tenuifilaceae bacterium]
MKTAIVYDTSHGTTEKVANMIASFNSSIEIFNLKENKNVNMDEFDQVIIGGSIHVGKIRRRVKEFCLKNLDKLLQKRVGLYLCAMNEPEYENELKLAFPEELRNHAVIKKVVGGEFLFDRMNFLERFIVKKISGINETTSKLDEKGIMQIVDEMGLRSM